MLPHGTTPDWTIHNSFPLLYVIYSGKGEVQLDGEEPFQANARDIIHIPNRWGGKLTVAEDTVQFDYNCQSDMLRALEELHTAQINAPKKLTEDAFIAEVMTKNDCHVRLKKN